MDDTRKSHLPAATDAVREAVTLEGTTRHLHVRQVISNRYEILEKLGRGEMGDVWRAYDLKLRVDVALKSLRGNRPDAAEALRREVRTAREVISPNVCRIFDLVVEEGQELVSMEYIDGQTLLALLQERSPLELREAREIASQFLAGLEAIHQAGLVHRDLKPENIMITRTGRVVVMDFGIAKPAAQVSGTIAGTLPYMAPEQLSGGKVDARSDVFSAGVLLAEMTSSVHDHESRGMLWKAIREEPPKLPDTPWQAVIVRALAKFPEDRFTSAGALSRALEEVTQRVKTIEEKKPYPGLSSFTEGDAEYFFGRELEAETVLKKLQELHLMAIIGPSGAGKTSFLRAGLIPVLPNGWSHVFCTPGDTPLVNLGQSLVPELSQDMEAMRKMVRLEDTDSALWLLHRWSQNHPQALLIVDRFEELFTLNSAETQSRFAELLGRAALEADVRVLLSMRDDFLMFCHEHSSLVPIFSELTGLSPLTGASLRRALVQPALKCGYRFEDEKLVDEILADVEKERGALPLMAFAAARLWEKRDRQSGQLTGDSYKEIGGVAGALAQHAEITMERIGTERHFIVRELFRNLITAQNTRTARDTEEILSIFENQQSAEEVLRSLIDARLLISFEAPAQEGEEPKRRVEIIHESLLSAWPRLVRWQTQDADSAQFRDQLRQAAHLWEERSRPTDLLWTGASYREFELWRERYSGGLTATEKAFSDAMLQHTRNQRTRRRLLLATIFVILLGILGVIVGFWKGEKKARQEAVTQAQRAEASKLLALGRMELDQDPTFALAYAIASLELADTSVARRFALQALWKAPPSFIMTDMAVVPTFLNFSPGGKRLAVGGYTGSRLLRQDGSEMTVLTDGYAKTGRPHLPLFSPKGDSLVWSSSSDPNIVQVWSVSQGKVSRNFKMEGPTNLLMRGSHLIMITDLSSKAASKTPQREQCRIRTWSFDEKEPRIVSDLNWKDILGLGTSNNAELLAYARGRNFDISNDATLLAYGRDRSVYIRPLEPIAHTPETLVGKHDHDLTAVLFHPDGKHIASADIKGEIRIWSLSEDSKNPLRTITARGSVWNLFFNSSGSILAVSYDDNTICLWDMNGPSDADPFVLQRRVTTVNPFIGIDPFDRWVAIPYHDSLRIWPLKRVYPYVLHGEPDGGAVVSFTQDGKWLVSGFSDGRIRLLLDMNNFQAGGRDLKNPPVKEFHYMDLDPTGKYFAIASLEGAFLISISDGKTRRMPGLGAGVVSFSPNGRFLAAESWGEIPVWDIESNQVQILKPSSKMSNAQSVQFSPDGSLFSNHTNGDVYQWDVEKETNRLVAKGNQPGGRCKVPRNNPHILVCHWLNEGKNIQNRSELRVIDLRSGNSYPITTHGNHVWGFDVDSSGTVLATGDLEGILRIGPITGEEPHLLFGLQARNWFNSIAISPDGQWIASSEGPKTIVRLWRMPKGKPLHTLPYDELLKKLRSLTNVRIVADQTSSTGYRIHIDRFPGWEKVPAW